MGGKGGSVFKNNYKGHMDKTKVGGIRRGGWGWLGCAEVGQGSGVGKMQTTVLEQV